MKKYKTAQLKVWKKVKEIRQDIYREIAEAKDTGKLAVCGSTGGMVTLVSGFDAAYLGGEPYGASVAFLYQQNPALYQEIVEASEQAGYPRDLCAYMRNYFGSIIVDKYAFGGPFPKFDFCLQTCMCDTHAKWYQIVSELEGIPLHCIELVVSDWEQSNESEKVKQLKVDYGTQQVLEAIDWMIKTSGREYDDEKFIQGVLNECESGVLFAKVCSMNMNIPAPLDEKSLFSLYVLSTIGRHRSEVVEAYTELLAEVEERVANEIAASPYEECRLLSDSQPPWFNLSIFRVLESYGAVSVGAHYSMGMSGGWEYSEEEDTWVISKTPQEQGLELKTREDAARVLVEWWLLKNSLIKTIRHNGFGRNKRMLDMVDKWHAEGVLIHLNRGCEGLVLGQMEMHHALMQAGIPCVTYEGNHADPREYDELRTLARIESFMETLGHRKIVE